jgi:membrane-associated phospholipid phosphatase
MEMKMRRNAALLSSAIFVILISICTFIDLPLSMAVVNRDSYFGQFFAAFGQLALPLILGFCFASLGALTKVLIGRILYLLCAYAAYAVAAYMVFTAPYFTGPREEGDLLFWGSVLISGLLLILLFCPVAVKLAAKRPAPLRRAAWIGILTFAIATLAVEGLKVCMGRQRFRSMTDPGTQFTPWFVPKGPAAGDDFKSFPSGHSFRAAFSLWVVFLPVAARTKSTKTLLISLGVAWTLLVMISRIIVGAHFATDVLFGAFIPLFVFFCLSVLIKPTKSDS